MKYFSCSKEWHYEDDKEHIRSNDDVVEIGVVYDEPRCVVK